MAKIGLFFGSDDGNTESIAARIQARFAEGVVDIHDVADVTQLDFNHYDQLVLAIPTWDFGQIQSDWEDFWDDIREVDFHGKQVALVGLGDQFGYGDYFLDALGMLHDVVKENGAEITGYWPVEGYEFDASKALSEDGKFFVGLAIDEDQQEDLTSARLNQWCKQVAEAFGITPVPVDLDD